MGSIDLALCAKLHGVKAAYDQIGRGYSNFRTTDPDIAAAIGTALGSVDSVLNVGAGTGSYEACAPGCIAIEPSSTIVSRHEHGTT
jgi:hypothetical protein